MECAQARGVQAQAVCSYLFECGECGHLCKKTKSLHSASLPFFVCLPGNDRKPVGPLPPPPPSSPRALTHPTAMQEGKPSAIGTAATALSESSARLHESLAAVFSEVDAHASHGLNVLARLNGARQALVAAREDSVCLRTTYRIVSDLERVRDIMECGGGEVSLRNVGTQLEAAAYRTFQASGGVAEAALPRSDVYELSMAVRTGKALPVSQAAIAALTERVSAFQISLQGAWRSWLQASADMLFKGARALALQPPGNLTEGLDGLDRERAAVVQGMALLALAERADDLLALLDAAAAAAEGGGVAKPRQAASIVQQALQDYRVACCERLTAELETACRLVGAHAGADPATMLEAVAEAAKTAARAARAVASVLGLLPTSAATRPYGETSVPPSSGGHAAGSPSRSPSRRPSGELQGGEGEVGSEGEAADGDTPSPGADVMVVHELASATDELIVLLRQAPADQPAASGLRRHFDRLLRRQLDVAPRLMSVADSQRGRRVLSLLGEAGERLEQAAYSQAQTDHGS